MTVLPIVAPSRLVDAAAYSLLPPFLLILPSHPSFDLQSLRGR